MNYLSVEKLSKTFGEKWLFDNISFGIQRGEKVALVGANGTGKSTLLKILSGSDAIIADSGEATFRNEIKVGHLFQHKEFEDGQTVEDVLYGENETAQLVKNYQTLIEDINADQTQLQEVLTQMEELNAWNFESLVHQITGKLGIQNIHQEVNSLSGGQQKRVALAQLLLSEPDFIILDEPTNHLDVEAIEWLESFLSDDKLTILLVTHDRYFMDSVANQILELENGKIFHHKGNYASYLENKAEREQQLLSEVEKAKNLYKKELDWIRRQPKARGTKAKYRVEAFDDIKKKAHTNTRKAELNIDVKSARQGGKILEVENIQKSFDDTPIINDFSYIFKKKERIGIVGKNGTGKSTFLNMLTKQLEPDKGRVIVGQTTVYGYFTQNATELNLENRVIEEVKEIADYFELSDGTQLSVGRFLEMFLFSPQKQFTYISKLSGGERKRLQLLKVLVKNPNFLILDEPTNDLDLDTMNVLEEFLSKFGGCLLIVSHDRYFLDRLTDHLFIFDGSGTVKDFNGNYTDYRQYEKELELEKLQEEKKKKSNETKEEKPSYSADEPKATYKEKQEYIALEKEIETLETEKSQLVGKINSGETDHEKLSEWSIKIGDIDKLIETKSMRWMELAEKGAG